MILLDVMMPGLDGWGVAEALLEDERTAEIPIIFLTARAEFRDRAHGLDIGGVDYITKPFNPVELAPLVRAPRPARARRARRAAPREAHRAPRPHGENARGLLAAGEVGGDDGGAVVAEEVALDGAEADPVPARPEQVRAVARAQPSPATMRGRRVRPGAPGEVLAEGRAARPRRSSRLEHAPWVKTSFRIIVAE